MSEVSNASNLPGGHSAETTMFQLTGGDLSSIPVANRLNSKNYFKWSQIVRTLLKGMKKTPLSWHGYGTRWHQRSLTRA